MKLRSALLLSAATTLCSTLAAATSSTKSPRIEFCGKTHAADATTLHCERGLEGVGNLTQFANATVVVAAEKTLSPKLANAMRDAGLKHLVVRGPTRLNLKDLRLFSFLTDLTLETQRYEPGTPSFSLGPVAGLVHLQRLEVVSRNGTTDVAPLAHLPLESLSLTVMKLKSLQKVDRKHQLTSLQVEVSDRLDVSAAVAHMTSLQSLSVNRPVDSRALVGMKALHTLQVRNADFRPLASLPIQDLSVGSYPEALGSLNALKRLRRLTLVHSRRGHSPLPGGKPRAWQAPAGGLPADVRLPNLEELRLQNYDTVAAEAHLPALKRLYVRGLKLDDLRAVQKHPKLECLVVDSASVTSLEDLRGHPSLQALNAPFASDIRAVSSLPRLRSLVLSRRVADVSPAANAKLTEVFVDVPDVPMSTFHNMTNLKHVAIGRWAAATLDAKAFGKDGRGITVAHSEQKAPWAYMPLLQKSCGGLAELGWR